MILMCYYDGEIDDMKEYDRSIESLMYTYYLTLSEKDQQHYATAEAAKFGQ